ncbi:methyltransferase domain-containing protein [Methylomonas sp. AM2-LC]|uniref:class I SAM-dependent methyltransferase n=1 Tax=Methylomonas sp. AM2-LC TaxID=3153301 RepID=UPI0032630706
MSELNEALIIESWGKNVLPWINAITEGQIESRRIITDQAIINAIVSCSPQSAIDIGCGEGWLARSLNAKGISTIGVDAQPGLVKAARQAGGGDFRLMSYANIADRKLIDIVDVVVCNFSLLGKASVEALFGAVPYQLNAGGSFIVQTLHPAFACGELPYKDGWREGSWAGFNADFTEPAPWYFRTIESWIKLFTENGFHLREIREPIHPKTLKPASIIFMGSKTINK